MSEEKRKLHLEQLYTENSFLYFCNTDERNGYGKKLGVEITPEFLRACEKDGFIIPLHEREEKIVVDGKETTAMVKLYSPFQLFLVAELCYNIVGDDGFLYSLMFDISYQHEQKTRYISWGASQCFNIDNGIHNAVQPSGEENHHRFMANFHEFLKLLHSCDLADNTNDLFYESRRLYTSFPRLLYDLTPLKGNTKILPDHNLDSKKVKHLYKIVGGFALSIDPLGDWSYYIQKHSLLRKDELKGLAGVAQEIYHLGDILRDIFELVSGEALPPLVEFVKSDFYHDRDKVNQYAEGQDILAIKKANQQLLKWISDNENYLHEMFVKNPEWTPVNFVETAEQTQKNLEDFHIRYGDVRSVGGHRMVTPSDIAIKDLDTETQKILRMYMSGSRQKDVQYEITNAISSRLRDLQRDVSGLAHRIAEVLYSDTYRVEKEKRASVASFQIEYFSKKEEHKDAPNPQMVAHKFYSEFLPKAQKKFQDELDVIEQKRRELNNIAKESGVVLCAVCRESKVLLHQEYRDEKLSNEAICDSCVHQKDLQSVKDGEWYCDYEKEDGETCNTLLYKFAHNNILNTNLLSGSNASIVLNYGQMEIEVKCKNCKNKSRKIVDWGWLA